MKKFAALGYLLGFPVAFAGVIPQIVAILLMGAGFPSGISGVFPTYAPALMGALTTIFPYFVSGFFPTGGGISNFIMGL